jgi:hypothetical protein
LAAGAGADVVGSAAHDDGGAAASRASACGALAFGAPALGVSAPGTPQLPAVTGAVSCHADGARTPTPLAARWSFLPAGIQSGVHDSRVAAVSHGGTGSADRSCLAAAGRVAERPAPGEAVAWPAPPNGML